MVDYAIEENKAHGRLPCTLFSSQIVIVVQPKGRVDYKRCVTLMNQGHHLFLHCDVMLFTHLTRRHVSLLTCVVFASFMLAARSAASKPCVTSYLRCRQAKGKLLQKARICSTCARACKDGLGNRRRRNDCEVRAERFESQQKQLVSKRQQDLIALQACFLWQDRCKRDGSQCGMCVGRCNPTRFALPNENVPGDLRSEAIRLQAFCLGKYLARLARK